MALNTGGGKSQDHVLQLTFALSSMIVGRPKAIRWLGSSDWCWQSLSLEEVSWVYSARRSNLIVMWGDDQRSEADWKRP